MDVSKRFTLRRLKENGGGTNTKYALSVLFKTPLIFQPDSSNIIDIPVVGYLFTFMLIFISDKL